MSPTLFDSGITPCAFAETKERPPRSNPRLGFLGVGWIGRNRMEAIANSGLAEVAAIADAIESSAVEATKAASRAERVASLEDLLKMDLDGMVIATPSA